MWSQQSKLDRIIYLVSILLVLVTSYLMYDDSVFTSFKNDQVGQSIGQIVDLNKDVRKKKSKKFFWQSARSKDTIYEGDSLFTGNDSNVKVKLTAGQLISLKENSMTVFKTSDQGLKLDLQYGRIEGSFDGCVQLETKNATQNVCGKNSQLDISADGKIEKVDEKPATDQITLHSSSDKFVHLKNLQDLTLKWDAIGNYGRYKVQFSTTPDFKFIRLEQKFQQHEIKTKKYPTAGKYYIRVIGESVENSNTIISSITSNTVSIDFKEAQLPLITFPVASEQFLLETNYDNELTAQGLKDSRISFQWSYLLPESRFDLKLATDENFSQIVLDKKNLNSMNFKSESLQPGQYYFKVRDSLSEKLADAESYWSKPTSFTIKKQAPPLLQTPELITKQIEHLIPQPEKISLQWKKSKDAAKYVVEISADSKFRKKESIVTKKMDQILEKTEPGTLFFKVYALTEKNTRSLASDVGQVQTTLQKPILDPIPSISKLGLTPTDPGAPQTIRAQWSALKNINSYSVQIAKDHTFTNSLEIKTSELNSEITIPTPGNYSVRVQGLDSEGKPVTEISNIIDMQYVLTKPLYSPEPLEPQDQITLFFQKNSSVYVRLKWSAVKDANEYIVEVATDKDFQNKIISQKTIKTNYQIQSQLPTTDLYWRVMAQGQSERISQWSAPRKMSVFSGRAPATQRKK